MIEVLAACIKVSRECVTFQQRIGTRMATDFADPMSFEMESHGGKRYPKPAGANLFLSAKIRVCPRSIPPLFLLPPVLCCGCSLMPHWVSSVRIGGFKEADPAGVVGHSPVSHLKSTPQVRGSGV